MDSERHFLCDHRRPKARLRLVCFPWAGGYSAYYSKRWGARFPEWIEVVGVVMPGRESRHDEPHLRDVAEAEEKAFGEPFLKMLREKPFAFFGHSMGCAYAITACLYAQRFGLAPLYLFVSGCIPPMNFSEMPIRQASTWSRGKLIAHVQSIGVVPEHLLRNKDAMDIWLPLLVADFDLTDTQTKTQFPTPPILSCPVATFSTKHDPHSRGIEGWQKVTTGKYSHSSFEGDAHFYLLNKEHEKRLISTITSLLQHTLTSSRL